MPSDSFIAAFRETRADKHNIIFTNPARCPDSDSYLINGKTLEIEFLSNFPGILADSVVIRKRNYTTTSLLLIYEGLLQANYNPDC
jgi:hypothetical protein